MGPHLRPQIGLNPRSVLYVGFGLRSRFRSSYVPFAGWRAAARAHRQRKRRQTCVCGTPSLSSFVTENGRNACRNSMTDVLARLWSVENRANPPVTA